MVDQIELSIAHQQERLKSIFKDEIKQIDALRGKPVGFKELLANLAFDKSLTGWNSLLPFYYILNHDYNMGWILLNYLNLRFGLNIRFCPEVPHYHENALLELESPVVWDMKPLWRKGGEDRSVTVHKGSTCFRLTEDFVMEPGDDLLKANEARYDISPEARYKTVGKTKEYYLAYEHFFILTRLLEVYFRQERIAETEECLFRLRHILSRGEPPKYLMDHPRVRNVSTVLNMYEAWYQGRRETDPIRRKNLGWQALYWFLENGIRLVKDSHIDYFHLFSDGCEIIGEFELMGDRHEEFLRHLKRFVMHASISYCKKMMKDPVQVIPFSERNMPGYKEFQELILKKMAPE